MTVSKMFEGVTCKDAVPQPQGIKQTERNLSKLQDAMGMSAKCKTLQKKSMRNKSTSGGMSGGMKVLGGLGGSASFSANFQTASAALDAELRKEACGSVMMDTKEIMDVVRRMNCTITQNSAETSTQLKARASVEVKIVPIDGAQEKLQDTLDKLAERVERLKNFPEIAKMIASQMKSVGTAIETFGTITMQNATLKAKAGSKIRSLSQNAASMTSKLDADYKQIAKTVATNAIQQKSGPNAIGEQIKSLIDTKIQRQTDDINSEIAQSLSATKVRVDQSGKVLIEAPNAINLKGVTLDANVETDLVTSAITSSSVELGKRIASELMTEAASKTDVVQESEGESHADLLKAMNEGNAAAIKAQSDGLIGQIKAISGGIDPILIVVLIAAAGAVKGLGGRGGGGGGGDTGDKQLNPRTQMIYKVVGILVRLLLLWSAFVSLPTSFKELTDFMLPWRWGSAWDRIQYFVYALILFLAYCFSIGPSGNPLLCLIKVW